MHENRETPCAPALSAGRSAKAHGRKADMNAEEESDRGVVPVSQPNNEAQVSAEAGEGRPRTKENIRGAHTPPTLSGERVSQGLSGVRQTARERKREKFTALLHHMNVALLRDSFYLLKKNAAPGVDGVRWQEYEDGLEDRLTDLHGRVHRGAYRAQPSRRVFIPKPDGHRQLGGQDCSTGGGDHPQSDLRGGLQRLFVRVSSGPQFASGAGRAECGHSTAAYELHSRCGHPGLLRPCQS